MNTKSLYTNNKLPTLEQESKHTPLIRCTKESLIDEQDQLSNKTFLGIPLHKIKNNEFPSKIEFTEFVSQINDTDLKYGIEIICRSDNNDDDSDDDSVCSDDSGNSNFSYDGHYIYVDDFCNQRAIKLKIDTDLIYWIGSIGINVKSSFVCTVDYRESTHRYTYNCEECCDECEQSYFGSWCWNSSCNDGWYANHDDPVGRSNAIDYIEGFILEGELKAITLSKIYEECRNFHDVEIKSIKIIDDFNTIYSHSQTIIKDMQLYDKKINDQIKFVTKEENVLISLEEEKRMIHKKYNFDSPEMMDDFLVNAHILVTKNAINKAKSLKVIDDSEAIISQYQTIIEDFKLYDRKIERYTNYVSIAKNGLISLEVEKRMIHTKYNFDSREMMDDFLMNTAILNTKNTINKVKPLLSS